MIIKRFIELENNYFLDKLNKKNAPWTAILMCWRVTIISRRSLKKKYAQRKRWIHSLEAPTRKMLYSEINQFSRRRDVKLLK